MVLGPVAPDPGSPTVLTGEGLVDAPGEPTPPTETARTGPIQGRSLRQIAWRRFKRDKVADGGRRRRGDPLILVAVFAPLIVALLGHPPDEFHQDAALLDLTPRRRPRHIRRHELRFLFGLEPQNGRDMFSRVIYGSRVSLLIAFLATLLSVVIGTVLGMIAGYFGGWVDSLVGRAWTSSSPSRCCCSRSLSSA